MNSQLSHIELEDAASPEVVLIARALSEIASALRQLGVNNAATEMGAIEAVAMELKEGLASIAGTISEHAFATGPRS